MSTVCLPASSPVVYTVEVIRSLRAFESLADEWDTLLEEAAINSLTMTHAWLMTCLQHFPPDELLIILVRENNGKLVGAAPLKISTAPAGLFHRLLRFVQFIGTSPNVYEWMTFALHPVADSEQVIRQMAQYILQIRERWDVIDLQYMPHLERIHRLTNALSGKVYRLDCLPTMSIPFLNLPSTIEAYQNTPGRRSLKKKMNHYRNRLKTDFPGQALHLEVMHPSPEMDHRVDELCDRHIAYWRKRGCRSDLLRYPRLRAFYQSVLRQFQKQPLQPSGRVILSVLHVGDTPISYRIGQWHHHTYTGQLAVYNTDFAKYSPGTLHTEALIEKALEKGIHRFEFGRGSESYKTQWADQEVPLWNVQAFRTPLAYLLWQADNLLKQLLRKPRAV